MRKKHKLFKDRNQAVRDSFERGITTNLKYKTQIGFQFQMEKEQFEKLQIYEDNSFIPATTQNISNLETTINILKK